MTDYLAPALAAPGEGARPVHEQLRDAISAQAVRVIELFREWDADGDGTVSKKEVRRSISPPHPA